ncbi:endonuclease/exonuclease/phosphatase family protein [Streptomyces sp. ISL-24]
MTVNVLEKDQADWDGRRQLLIRGIRAAQPDVVALQEVVRAEGYDGASDLLGEGWHVAFHPCWSADGVGAVLASRWPFGVLRTDSFRTTERIELAPWCGVVAAEVLAPAPFGPMLVVHHKPNWPRGHEREREGAGRDSRPTCGEHGGRPFAACGSARRLRCRPGKRERAVLAWPAVPGRDERLLSRCVGRRAPGRTRPHLLSRQPSRAPVATCRRRKGGASTTS